MKYPFEILLKPKIKKKIKALMLFSPIKNLYDNILIDF